MSGQANTALFWQSRKTCVLEVDESRHFLVSSSTLGKFEEIQLRLRTAVVRWVPATPLFINPAEIGDDFVEAQNISRSCERAAPDKSIEFVQ
jgi:hypothetical protein